MNDEAVAFDTLIYTDCQAGQGLKGQAGLQFQARSSAAAAEAEDLVRLHLLYEPPVKWMGEQRPPEAYPPSFAHVWKGLLATAAGFYVGRERDGGREGNIFTHSIVTSDPAAYRLVRPAQLHKAGFWTRQPASTTNCPPLASGWEPGPLGIAEAQELVKARPDGDRLLVALVSSLERMSQPDRRRILFIGEDPDEILGWIAAATLLLAQPKALGISFKVYSTDPAHSGHDVVAVHPDWGSTRASVDNDLGYVVVDFTQDAWSQPVPTRNALAWVEAFCAGDPYDVVDAIEVSAASGLGEDEAPVVGRTAIMREPLTEAGAEVLVRWLRTTPPTLMTAHRGEIVDQLTRSVERWPRHILRALDDVARTGQAPDDRASLVRLALIRAELARAARDGAIIDPMTPSLRAGTWCEEDQYAAEQDVVAALTRAPATSFDPILRLADTFGLGVNLEDVAEPARRFVTDWADHPRAYDLGAWPCGAELDAMLDAELSARIDAGGAEAASHIGDAWWQIRWRQSRRLRSLLDHAVVAAGMARGDQAFRMTLVDGVIAMALDQDPPDTAVTIAAEVLWRRVAPTRDELAALAERTPAGVAFPGQLFAELAAELRRDDISQEDLMLAKRLVTRGAWRPPADVAALVEADRRLRRVCDFLTSSAPGGQMPNWIGTNVRAARDRVLRPRTEPLLNLLMRGDHPEVARQVVLNGTSDFAAALCDTLSVRLQAGGSDKIAAMAVYLCGTRALTKELIDQLAPSVARWHRKAAGKDVKRAKTRVKAFGAGWDEIWDELVNFKPVARKPAARSPRWRLR